MSGSQPSSKRSGKKTTSSQNEGGGESAKKEGGKASLSNKSGKKEPERFAWSSYQSVPDPSEVPKPSSRMLANAQALKSSWMPATLPQVEVQQEEDAGDLTAQSQTLMKILGVGMT